MNVQLIDNTISSAQAETFAYNIYRDAVEYIKANLEEFLWWYLEEISKNIVLTCDGIELNKDNYVYEACRY